MRVDAHQHFWHYDGREYAWIDDSMSVLKHDYLPEAFSLALKANAIDSCLAVQARQTHYETEWLLELAETHSFIAGVVGWVDLCDQNIESHLDRLDRPKLVGYRHILQGEPDDEFMLRTDFIRGLAALSERGLTYDLLVFPRHLTAAIKLLNVLPDLKIVVDHGAKPPVKSGVISPWQDDLRSLASHPNVYCKLSGLATEAAWSEWTVDHLKPYVEWILQVFGPDRVMFGSDWPVCLLATSYDRWVETVSSLVPPDWHARVFGNNAARFYGLA